MRAHLGSLGIWAHADVLDAHVARAIEPLGYSAIWIGGSPGGDLSMVDPLLDATQRLVVATGIVNIWADDAKDIAAAHRRLSAAYPGRFVLGIGAGHPEATSDYTHPYQAMVAYLDVLEGEGVPQDEVVLAALGPRVLRLARERTAGAHPYLVTPEHTRAARDLLGPDRLLAPEQKVVLDTDIDRARSIARPPVAHPYLELTNYTSNLRRLGWTDDDIADGGSDALIDALVAQGDAGALAARVRAHLDAGADHVPVQVITADGADRLSVYRALAEAFAG